MEPSKEALLPCPFCGGEATTDKYVISKEERKWGAYCRNPDCGVSPQSRMFDTETEAITTWNTRPAALRAEVEALRARVAEWEAETSKEITVVEARLEAQRKRLTRWTKQTNDL